MNFKIDQQKLDVVREKLDDFEGTGSWDTREVEAAMEALASQIYLLAGEGPVPKSLAEALRILPVDVKTKRQLIQTCRDLQDAMDTADYDSDDEDKENRIDELKSDFYNILHNELETLGKRE